MSEQPVDALTYVTGRIVIEMGLTADGDDQVWTKISGATDDEDRPPLVTALGMIEMARDSVYALYADVDDEDDD